MGNKLFRNGTIISFDDATKSLKILRGASLFVVDNKIAALGDNVQVPADTETIDVSGKIITPGFVNTHSHMWQTAFRTLAPNTTLAEYFLSYGQYSPTIRSFSPDDIYISCLEGYLEGLNGGVTSVVEHAHSCWDIGAVRSAYEATVDSGARVYWCLAIEDRDGCSSSEQIDYLQELNSRNEFKDNLVSLGLAYDTMGSAAKESVEKTKQVVKELDMKAITIHHLGPPWPVGDNGPAKGVQQGLQDTGLPVVFSHCGLSTQSDWDAAREQNWNISITPESEYLYGHGNQTTRFILDQASLGIDTNWTFSGDILSQARLWLESTRNTSYNKTLNIGKIPRQSPMTVETAFLLATRQGGRAVRRHDLGVLKVGAQADIVVWDGDSPNMLGWTDPVAAVILHANVGDIQHVMVNGEFRKRDGKLELKKGEWADISAKFATVARRIQNENSGPKQLPEKLFGIGEFGDVEISSTKRERTADMSNP